MTRDKGFGDIRAYPLADYQGIVVLDLPTAFTAQAILRVLDTFLLAAPDLLITRHWIAIVEPGHMRIRHAREHSE